MGYIADKFEEENPNVSVKLVTVSQEQKNGSNLSVLASASPPDVGVVPVNSEAFTQLTRADALADLSAVWKNSDLDERYGDAGSALKVSGVPYVATVTSVGYNVVFYNPALFERVGIDAPENHRFTSVDQLVDAAERLREAGLGPMQIGGSSGYEASWMIDAMLPTIATGEQMANYLSSFNPDVKATAKYTDPAFEKTLESIDKLAKSGVFQDGFLGQDSAIAKGPFVQGFAGMALGATASLASFEDAAFTPAWALLPPMDDDATTQISMYFGDAIGIPAQAKEKEWAEKFVEFVLSDRMQEEAIIGAGAALPSVNSLSEEALAKLPDLSKEFLADIKENGSQPGWTASVPGGFGQQFIDPLMQQMFAGDLTPDEVAAKQQAHLLETRENAG
ncbi:extracellular solute-binding protein [Microbacterium sp. NPDC090281]|uniref:extracellular solute-binding protein n=1 Tax=Microbacterium sp. NPDC090281 TaxID=3364208 RepID=UPI0038087400